MISFANANRQITIKSPDFMDSKSLGLNLAVTTMMDSSMTTYRSKSRIVFSLKFSALSRVKAEEIRDFFDVTSGQQLFYVDDIVAGAAWSGYIINDTLKIVNEGPGRLNPGGTIRAEAFKVEFDFEVTDAHSND